MKGSRHTNCRRIVAVVAVCALPVAILGCVLGRQDSKAQALKLQVVEPAYAAAQAPAPAPQPPRVIEVVPAAMKVGDHKSFDGRSLRPAKTVWMTVTAYSPDARSCGKWAAFRTTASGYSVETNGFRSVAADTRVLPFGTLLTIPGYHNQRPVPVLDRGGAIKGDRLDVLFPTHEEAMQWGRQRLLVTVWEYQD